MPTAALKPCVVNGCPELTEGGRCPTHRTQVEQRRGSAFYRGYGSSQGSAWQVFRRRFKALLIAQDIPPVCGATLPGGPVTQDSLCKQQGRLTFTANNGQDLHYDHEPPLTEQERQRARTGDRSAFDDPLRIQLLCRDCDTAKTNRQRGGL